MEKINDKKGLSESCNIRGLTFLLQEKYDRAEAEYKKALALRQEIKTPKGISATLYNLADLYLEVERNQEAMILLYQVVEIERKIGNKPYLAMTYGLIARQLVRDKKYIEALSFLKKADEEGENDQSLFIKRDNARSYVFYYNAIKDYKNALAYQKEYQWLNDEIFERNGSDKIAQYEALYKIEKREKEIEILTEKQRNQEAKIQLQQSELVRKNTILVSIGVVLVLLIFIGIVGIKANRAKEEANQELQQLNRQVAEKGRIAEYNLLQVEQLKGDLELREKLYRDLVENASDIIHELDEEGRFTYVNHAAERITGYREEEIIGSHYSMFIHPDYSERVKSFISDQKAGRLEFSYQEFPILSKQGEIVWLGQSTRLFFDGNRVWKTAVVARDITKQKLAEERLKKSQHEYVEWLNTIPIGIYTIQTMTDGSFKFLYVSPRWCEMNGVSKESVLADSTVATALILPDDRASFVKANRKIRDHYSFEWEGRLIVKGEIRYMRIASRSKKLDDGTFLSTGYQLDITFQKANETDKVK